WDLDHRVRAPGHDGPARRGRPLVRDLLLDPGTELVLGSLRRDPGSPEEPRHVPAEERRCDQASEPEPPGEGAPVRTATGLEHFLIVGHPMHGTARLGTSLTERVG